MAHLGCAVAQVGCGVAQVRVRRGSGSGAAWLRSDDHRAEAMKLTRVVLSEQYI